MMISINEDSSSLDEDNDDDNNFVVLNISAAAAATTTTTAARRQSNKSEEDDADLAAGNARKKQQPSVDNDETTLLLSIQPSIKQQHQQQQQQSRRRPTAVKKEAGNNKKICSESRRPRPTLQRSSSTSFNTSLRSIYHTTNQSFRILKRQSSSIIESLNSNLLPATPTGWALGALSLCSMGLQYELRLQKELTAPPIVFCQANNANNNGKQQGSGNGVLNERMNRIYNKLSSSPSPISALSSDGQSFNKQSSAATRQGIFSRTVTPSLFIGTRGIVSSAAAYALGSKHIHDGTKVKRVREVMKMGADGALIVLDWEVPLLLDSNKNTNSNSNNNKNSSNNNNNNAAASYSTIDNNIDISKPNSIAKPIILLLHGMNNDSTFGYIRSMMRTATDRGWIAVCMNLRGQDGLHQVKNTTPRGYNAGYTGDLRGVVEQLEYRLKKKRKSGGGRDRRGSEQPRKSTTSSSRSNNSNNDEEDEDDYYIGGPIYLLGYSLGANIVTKYLGEESLHGTLPKCIGGGAAMGNPLHIHSGTIAFPWNMILGAGVKRSILQNASSLRKHDEPGFQHAMTKALLAPTIGKLDDAAAPYLIRNDSYPPYATRIGFQDGEEYWWESSSHRYVGHVSVPLLKISAQDDFLVFGQFQRKLNHCLENPNVVVVKTRCGGHLGWQESPPSSSDIDGSAGGLLGGSGSWSDVAVADFIEALLQIRQEDREKRMKLRRGGIDVNVNGEEEVANTSFTPPKVMSRL